MRLHGVNGGGCDAGDNIYIRIFIYFAYVCLICLFKKRCECRNGDGDGVGVMVLL